MNTKATVFDIQKFSVHDGPGIRTIIFLKGCSLRCQWCANPESNEKEPELMHYPDKCIGCGKCIDICPVHAIESLNSMTTYHRERCVNCLSCASVCYSTARKISGKTMSVEDVMEEVDKDAIFYDSSGGGVTFSGGEPLLWPDFVKDVSAAVKKKGFNTVIETCGFFPEENFQKVRELIDLALFDIKFIDEEKHIRYCNASNKLILRNFRSVVESIPTIVRMPIIPGINDTPEDLYAVSQFLEPWKDTIKEINILPYHNLGVAKFDALGRTYLLNQLEAPSREHMTTIKTYFDSLNWTVKIGG